MCFNTAMNETKMNWENKDGSIQWKHFGVMVGGLWKREGWKERQSADSSRVQASSLSASFLITALIVEAQG